MATCPYCAKAADDKSRVCKNCGRALVQRCLACAEDIPVLSQVCPLCRTPQNVPAPVPQPVPVPPGPRPLVGWVGEERSIVLTLFLWFITCGLWGLVAFYQVGSDIKSHRPRSDIRPGLDIVLGILTCGVWFIFAVYNYSEALKQASQEEHGPVQDVTTLCTMLEVLKYFSAGALGIVSTLILQNELNQHWRQHHNPA
jgi:hypothetical protein